MQYEKFSKEKGVIKEVVLELNLLEISDEVGNIIIFSLSGVC